MFLSEGISFLQYLCHISLYLVSKSFVNFTPLQTGDVSMSSLRLILRLESESMSDANWTARLMYSSSVLATKFPTPAFNVKTISIKSYLKVHYSRIVMTLPIIFYSNHQRFQSRIIGYNYDHCKRLHNKNNRNELTSTIKTNLPTFVRMLTPTLWACTEPAIVTHGTPMYRDSKVVVVPAYGNVSKLQKQNKIKQKQCSTKIINKKCFCYFINQT